jgi:NADH-quinone oxidoreductase subunit L
MRKMGGVKEKAPADLHPDVGWHAALSGIGVPFIMGHGVGFAGFYFKGRDPRGCVRARIRRSASSPIWLGIAGAFMTAFYSARLMFLTFYGKYRGDHHTWDHATNRRPSMLIPLYVLAPARRCPASSPIAGSSARAGSTSGASRSR